jgi:hypothetical protein
MDGRGGGEAQEVADPKKVNQCACTKSFLHVTYVRNCILFTVSKASAKQNIFQNVTFLNCPNNISALGSSWDVRANLARVYIG